MRVVWTLLVMTAGLPLSLVSQVLRGEGYYNRYGQSFGPWQATLWPAFEFRTRCDGEQVRGSNVGPIKWTIEYRNRSGTRVTFDYMILPPGKDQPAAASGSGQIAPGKAFQKVAIVSTKACDEGVLTSINNVRFGSATDSVTESKPNSR